jgi:hypothetical protein
MLAFTVASQRSEWQLHDIVQAVRAFGEVGTGMSQKSPRLPPAKSAYRRWRSPIPSILGTQATSQAFAWLALSAEEAPVNSSGPTLHRASIPSHRIRSSQIRRSQTRSSCDRSNRVRWSRIRCSRPRNSRVRESRQRPGLWFVVLAVSGVLQIAEALRVLAGVEPHACSRHLCCHSGRRLRRARGRRARDKWALLHGGPRVRIRLPPAASPLRT